MCAEIKVLAVVQPSITHERVLKEMLKYKLTFLCIFILLLITSLSFYPVTHAVTGEVTFEADAPLTNAGHGGAYRSNFGTYVSIGGYDVYQVADRLLFYQNGVYVKNYVNPKGSGAGITSPYIWNSTHLILGCMADGTSPTTAYLYFLKVSTGTWTEIDSQTNGGVDQCNTLCTQSVYRKIGSTLYYVIIFYHGAGSTSGYYRFTYDGTTATSTVHHTTLQQQGRGSIVFVNSSISSQEVYIIGNYGDPTVEGTMSRFYITKMNMVADTITDIGASGADYTWGLFEEGTSTSLWGTYVYYVGATYVSSYYYVYVAFPNADANNTVTFEVIKFDDDEIYEATSTWEDLSSDQLTVRPLSDQHPVALGNGTYVIDITLGG